MSTQIRINENSTLIKVLSEPYVLYGRRGYQPVIDIVNVHTGEEGYLIISAQSLSEPLHEHSQSNKGNLEGLTFLIRKASKDRMSAYIVVGQA